MVEKKEYCVEEYGMVREYQSDALNFHLNLHLQTFDEMYAANGGVLGSPSHQFEKEQFARSASKSLIECQHDNNDEITALETMGTHYSSSLGVEFDITTCTEHGKDHSITNVIDIEVNPN